MRRLDLQEIHDHPRFPAALRDLVTDAMQSLWNFADSYRPILGRLIESVDRAGARQVLDLCSGGGGPWLQLARDPVFARNPPIPVRLTDKYPNQNALRWLARVSALIAYEALPVDATGISDDLPGFRTIFSSFHHFGPEAARRILADAMRRRRGVGVFEMARRSPRTMLAICMLPALSWFLTPAIRPFRWSRLLWTYLIPLVPFVLLYDGLASCLRAYSTEELTELVRSLAQDNYEWHIGEELSGWLPVTYLLGYPAVPST